MRTADSLIQAGGWAGAVAVLAAYGVVATGIAPVTALAPSLLNVGGAALLALSSWRRRSYPTMALNVAWACIGIASLAMTLVP